MDQTSTKNEKQKSLKSEHLLAKGYEIVKDLTVPVGTSNKDLGVEGQEPKTPKNCPLMLRPEKRS